ncbi:MAG: hypothetical protein BWY45_02106 [Euryarchaeota archaeon ADurb.Bin294]|nr:MAG: hypothetical protein BWY45_02106 [Euryarchaeota archaeon ADurb.Bin294]
MIFISRHSNQSYDILPIHSLESNNYGGFFIRRLKENKGIILTQCLVDPYVPDLSLCFLLNIFHALRDELFAQFCQKIWLYRGCCTTKMSFPQELNFHSVGTLIGIEIYGLCLIVLSIESYATASTMNNIISPGAYISYGTIQ